MMSETVRTTAMNCKFCQKGFNKWEHLRRHERSHTGSRPYVCRSCKRSFGRQDSLVRHERLHTRTEGALLSPVSEDAASGAAILESFQDLADQSPPGRDPTPASDLQQLAPAQELDFDLIWPDSENLYNVIMSSDAVNLSQSLLGILPFPGEQYPTSNVSVESASSFNERTPSIPAIPLGGSHHAVHNVSTMVQNLTSNVTAAIEASSISSVFLDECLHMFFVRFIPTLPVLHRASFVFKDCTHPLLLNAIAIGSLYLGPADAIAKGENLWRLAHAAVSTSWQTLITHRGPYDTCPGVQLVITALLDQIYGVLSKNVAIRTTSQAFHGMGFFWARQCGMFDTSPFSTSDLPISEAPLAEKEHQWKTWISRTLQQRAVLAHYMLDGLIAQMSGEPTSVRHASNQIRLACDDAAFDASTADEWLMHIRHQQADVDTPSFRSIYRLLFSPSDDFRRLSFSFNIFSLRVMLEGVQSFVSDGDDDTEATVGVPTNTDLRNALARIHESITQTICLPMSDKLELLLRWHAVCLDAIYNSALLCTYMCSRCNIDQEIWASTKKLKQDLNVHQWASTPDGRRSLLHAVAIQDIVEQLPRGRAHAIHMPSSLFAAATIYGVFSLGGLVSVHLPTTVDWKDVLCTTDDSSVSLAGFPGTKVSSDTTRYIQNARAPEYGTLTTRNLLYEFNSMQKLFGCLQTQWGVASDMGKVVDRWATLCR